MKLGKKGKLLTAIAARGREGGNGIGKSTQKRLCLLQNICLSIHILLTFVLSCNIKVKAKFKNLHYWLLRDGLSEKPKSIHYKNQFVPKNKKKMYCFVKFVLELSYRVRSQKSKQ